MEESKTVFHYESKCLDVGLLAKGCNILLERSPEIRIICIDGEVTTKMLALFTESAPFNLLQREEEDKVIDVTDLGIDTQLMLNILGSMVSETFSIEKLEKPGSTTETLVTVIKFYMKYDLQAYADLILRIVSDWPIGEQILFIYSYNKLRLPISPYYRKIIGKIRRNISGGDVRNKLQFARNKNNNPEMDALIFEHICTLD